MKYYGLRYKEKIENYMYFYARYRAKMLSLLPGEKGKYWKSNYRFVFEDEYAWDRDDNSLPQGKSFDLYSIVVADLIRREDIKKLQRGIRYLLKKRRANRFIVTPIEGLDEICKRVDQMDSTLLFWYNTVDCGFFEFKNHSLEESIDYFSVRICNINSAYLSLEFNIHLSQKRKEELNSLIVCNYRDKRGFAYQTMTGKSGKTGAYKNYTVTHYNNDFLKADKIYEFISKIEWEFLNELSAYFPFVLHAKGIMPPRIETYSTDIDYHDNNRYFWNSIGIEDNIGQFIDERHKMFFYANMSGRYENIPINNRIIYIFKDDDMEIGHFLSVKDEVYFHLKDYANEYFKFEFLDILSMETGKTLIAYKHRLDEIKLKRNHLKELLKLKYNLSLEIDDYERYIRDDIWEKAKRKIGEVYTYSDKIAKESTKPFFYSYSNLCDGAVSNSRKINSDRDIVLQEFNEKKQILTNLADYKNTARSIHMNAVTMAIAAITLFFTIFSDSAEKVADFIMEVWSLIK
ncbi:MAG: hypothetical protein NC124_21120 [Clostridium sp.]|nr:hypothetical protein [Clostridium sp.]